MFTKRGAIIALAATLSLAGCAALPSISVATPEPPVSSPEASLAPVPSATPTASDGFEDALVEREEFFVEQQQPLGQTTLVAVTPAQKEFISEQRAFVEGEGYTWSAEAETLALSLTLDACETAILNSHNVDNATYQTHVASSPLFALYQEDPAVVQNLSEVMVFGMSYICPADAPQWLALHNTNYQ